MDSLTSLVDSILECSKGKRDNREDRVVAMEMTIVAVETAPVETMTGIALDMQGINVPVMSSCDSHFYSIKLPQLVFVFKNEIFYFSKFSLCLIKTSKLVVVILILGFGVCNTPHTQSFIIQDFLGSLSE